jgi:hypothetical protein
VNTKSLSQKLRQAAQLLDDILGINQVVPANESPETVSKLLGEFDERRAKRKKRGPYKKGKHWTQTAAGKLKMKAKSKKRKKSPVLKKGYSYKGKHWTQTAAGKKRLSTTMKKHWAARPQTSEIPVEQQQATH